MKFQYDILFTLHINVISLVFLHVESHIGPIGIKVFGKFPVDTLWVSQSDVTDHVTNNT